MIRYILFFILFFTVISLTAQDVGFQWAGGFGTTSVEYNEDITTDEFGNIYMVGGFIETIDFDPGDGIYEVTSAGSYDCFILKLNSDGELVWVKTIGGANTDSGYAVEIDSEGNLIIIGNYRETVDFDPGPAIIEFTAEESSDGFILKLDSDGNFISVKTINGSTERPLELDIDPSGNIYITGTYSNTTDFDPGAGVYELSAVGEVDVFILKLNADGEFVWARSVGGGLEDDPTGIDVDTDGNVFIAGSFRGTADFDPGPSLYTFDAVALTDGFLLKLTPTGNFDWCVHFGGIYLDYYEGIVVGNDGNIYVIGNFEGEVDLDPSDVALNVTSAGSGDYFIQKLNTSGELIWLKVIGGTDADAAFSIDIDEASNIYLTGYFDGEVDFDPGPDVQNLTATFFDIYVQSLDSEGNFRWVKSMGGDNQDIGREVAVSNEGGVFATGEFRETVDFNPGLGEYPITSNGFRDFYVVKLSPCDVSSSTDVISACNSYTWIDGLTYTEDNNTANVTLENIDGCDSIVTLDLTIIELDNGISSSGATLTSDDADATYQWLDCNAGYSEIPGETSISYTADEDGSYAVRVQQGECVDTSECITIAGVGIGDENQLSDIKVFPNPSNGIVNVNLFAISNARIAIKSVNGSLVYNSINLSGGLHIIDLEVTPGLYFMLVSTPDGNKQFKLVVY